MPHPQAGVTSVPQHHPPTGSGSAASPAGGLQGGGPPGPARDQVRELVTPGRLREFLAPRSIALVGVSETSGWARFAAAASAAAGFTGPLIPVHPVHDQFFGRPVARSLRDLAEPPDLAFIMAPTRAVPDVVSDAAAAGVRGVIVLASGYREVGAAGRELEDQLVAQAAAAGITLLGPNCLGFINATAGVAPFALNVPLPLQAGPVGIALHSGALSSVVLAFARSHAIGISSLTSMGNEAMITMADMLEYLVDDQSTRVICLFLEEISEPARFAAAAARADEAGKPIVALKAGSTPAGQRAALAHTGSVAGDDAVVDAVLRQLNVIRVTSIEELLTTGALLGYDRHPAGRRMGVITASGGACDIIADRASELGIDIPPFAEQTAAAIEPHLPPFGAPRNPLDVTGYILANQRTSALTAVDHALDAAVADPGLDFVLFSGLTLPEVRPLDEAAARLLEERVAWLGQRLATAPVPVITISPTCVDVSPYNRELIGPHGIHVLGGMELGLRAIAHALRWQQHRGSVQAGLLARPPAPPASSPWSWKAQSGAEAGAAEGASSADVSWSEARARGLLAAAGVPLVPGDVAHSADEAAELACRIGLPVALKICSAQITHKSDIGGVALGLRTAAEVRNAYERVRAAGDQVPGAIIDGVLVTAMRTGGTELLAGVTVDPAFGPVLAVGLGGIWVELLGDTSLRALPADVTEVRQMLGELRGAALLTGARGGIPADLDAVAGAISRIGAAALSLGGSLRELEVNPLWIHGDHIEALDALVVTASGATPADGEASTQDGTSGTELGA